MRRISLEALSDDLLCQIIRQLDLYDKIRLQLVSRRLHGRLLRPLPGEGLWGRCNLSRTFKRFVKARQHIRAEVSRYVRHGCAPPEVVACTFDQDGRLSSLSSDAVCLGRSVWYT